MLKLRLQRRGKRNYATYRVVVAEDRAPIKGRIIADMGHYNPHTDEFVVKKEDVVEWMSKGVKPTPTVNNLLVEHKIIEGEKMTSWRPKVSKDSEDSKSSGDKPKETAEATADKKIESEQEKTDEKAEKTS